MTRLWIVASVLACASSAFGARLTMNVVGGGQEVTLVGSQQAQIEIWLHLLQGDWGWSSATFDLGGSTYDPSPEDFVWTEFQPGPYAAYLNPPILPMPGVGAWVASLYYYWPGWYCDPGPCYDFLLGTLTIHSAGLVSTDLIAFNTGPGALNEAISSDYVTPLFLEVGPGVTIHQFPEAASLTLLALGGLVLLRRR